MSIAALETAIGYAFRDGRLASEALTHRSYGAPNNERLEFLGDGVLNCIIAAELLARFPDLREGELSRVRAALVRENTLAELAASIRLGAVLRLGEGEAKSGGGARPSILADALEALIGAVFLDAGFDAVREVVARLYGDRLARSNTSGTGKDAKTALQELLQGRRLPVPVYSVVGTQGAAHTQTFEVSCAIPALSVTTIGRGSSRRIAEQRAASEALELLAPSATSSR